MSHGMIAKQAGAVGFFTLISRVTGLIRDIAIAFSFGTGIAADAFFVAFRIPNLLRRLFAEGALTISFVPVFTEHLNRDRKEAKQLADISWTLLGTVLVGVSLVGIIFSPGIVRLIAWGFADEPEKFKLTVTLTRLMFPFILLVSLAAWGMGVLNSLKHFAAPASASIFLNLGVIVGAIGLSRLIDPPVIGLAIGVLGGGLLQLAIHFPWLRQFGFLPKLNWNPSHPGVRKIVGMMIPAAFGAAVYQFNVIVITLLASFLPEGSVSYLWYADRVMEFPLGIFGIALATVLLPSLSDHVAPDDRNTFKSLFRYGLESVFFVTLPAAGGLIVLAEPIIRLIYEHGSFSEMATVQTSQALIAFAIGLPFIAAVRITSNAFFAFQDSKTPVWIASLAVGVNLVLSLILIKPLGHVGLALAISLSSLFNLVLQILSLRRKIGLLGLKKIGSGLMRIGFSTIVMMAGLIFVQGKIEGGRWEVFALILLGVILFGLMELLLGGKEIWDLLRLRRSSGSLSGD